jgi:hypothetical protein
MGFFSDDKVFFERDMKWENLKNSPIMKKLLADPEIASVLDKKEERAEFYSMLKTREKGGVTKRELREFLWELRNGKARTISPEEGRRIAWKMIPGRFAKRYEMSRGESSAPKHFSLPGSGGSAINSSPGISHPTAPKPSPTRIPPRPSF